MRVLTSQERQLQVREMLEQAFVPKRRAFRTGRIITSVLPGARITKSDRKNRHPRRIVEDRALQLEPLAQAIAACVIPRHPTAMDFAPRRLTDDQKVGPCSPAASTGRGPNGSSASQIRQARTSRNRRFSDIQKLSAGMNIAARPCRIFCPFNDFVRPHRYYQFHRNKKLREQQIWIASLA